jgi:hypothetical protein
MKRTRVNWIAAGWLLAVLPLQAGATQTPAPDRLKLTDFSSLQAGDPLPADWQPLHFRGIDRHTRYSLAQSEGRVVVKAVSEQSASGLVRATVIDPTEYPILRWRWKVDNTLQKGDVTRKAGDDYPARIYITFAFDPERAGYLERLQQQAARIIYGEDTPWRAISYLWGSNSPAGTLAANPYTDRTMMFIVRAGEADVGRWMTEQRNVYADYRTAFGEEPTAISGVAIMTDTDNTGESASAWYGDIEFLKQ